MGRMLAEDLSVCQSSVPRRVREAAASSSLTAGVARRSPRRLTPQNRRRRISLMTRSRPDSITTATFDVLAERFESPCYPPIMAIKKPSLVRVLH